MRFSGSPLLRRVFRCVACLWSFLFFLHFEKPLSAQTPSPEAPSIPPLAKSSYPYLFRDASKHEVLVPSVPKRLVSLAPSITQTLQALGVSDRLVATTRFCPPVTSLHTKEGCLARIESLDQPSVENLAALQPDLVLASALTSPMAVAQLRRVGMRVAVFAFAEIESSLREMEQIGNAVDAAPLAQALTQRIRERLDRIRQSVSQKPRRKVLLLYGVEDCFSTNHTTFAGQILDLVGAEHLASTLPEPWPRLSVEWIAAQNPEILLLAFGSPKGTSSVTREVPEPWRKHAVWSALKAVRDRAVYQLPEAFLSVPGPYLPEAAEAIAAILHPGLSLEPSSKPSETQKLSPENLPPGSSP